MDAQTSHRFASFQDFQVGQEILTASHLVSENEVRSFAQLSGDSNPLHTDPVYASRGPFGKRIAQGLLILSILSGLAAQSGLFAESVMAFRQMTCKFRKPVYIDDTIYARIAVLTTKPVPRLGGGLVDLGIKLYNQHDEIVQTGTWAIFIASDQA
jgi:3-hydroxybutyryl-CoA dehydratase